MKTKSIPVILMLIAGAISCIAGFVYQYETTQFFTMVFTSLVVFYFLGCIIKIVVDKNFSELTETNEGSSEEANETKENIESSNDENGDE